MAFMASPPTLLCVLFSYFSFSAAYDNQERGHPPQPVTKRSTGYYDPSTNGGSWLTVVANTYPEGLGEPINAVILGTSDSRVLKDQQTDGGLRNYFLSFDMAGECLGQHSGSDQGANLGDGNGVLNETAVIRYDYGDASIGTCQETVEGGNHFRYWVQNGDDADSGAIFMAVSYEKPVSEEHDIIFNGYNLARDWLVGNATAQSSIIPTLNLTNQSSYSGQSSYGGYVYYTQVNYVSGLVPNTSDGINHYLTVGGDGVNAADGLVAMWTVSVLEAPAGSSSSAPRTLSWLPTPTTMLIGVLVAGLSLPLVSSLDLL